MDKDLAETPTKYLPQCVRRGIAPAMKVDGGKTFWGTNVDDQEPEKTKRLLGIDRELHTPGMNAEEPRTERKHWRSLNYRSTPTPMLEG